MGIFEIHLLVVNICLNIFNMKEDHWARALMNEQEVKYLDISKVLMIKAPIELNIFLNDIYYVKKIQ